MSKYIHESELKVDSYYLTASNVVYKFNGADVTKSWTRTSLENQLSIENGGRDQSDWTDGWDLFKTHKAVKEVFVKNNLNLKVGGVYVSKTGNKVEVIRKLKESNLQLIGVMVHSNGVETIVLYDDNGKARDQHFTSFPSWDITGPWVEKKSQVAECWLNVYPSGMNHAYRTQAGADSAAGVDRIECVHFTKTVEWEVPVKN